jgi:hypothetical protein
VNGTSPGETWRVRAGDMVLSPEDPHGNPLPTPPDRRWLWRVENELHASAKSKELRQLAADLYAYLTETCECHWLEYDDTGKPGGFGPHRKCLWCGTVTFEGEAANQVARVILGTEAGTEGGGTP